MKTVAEWFNLLIPPYKDIAFRYAATDRLNIECDSLQSALGQTVTNQWPGGFEKWGYIYVNYKKYMEIPERKIRGFGVINTGFLNWSKQNIK